MNNNMYEIKAFNIRDCRYAILKSEKRNEFILTRDTYYLCTIWKNMSMQSKARANFKSSKPMLKPAFPEDEFAIQRAIKYLKGEYEA